MIEPLERAAELAGPTGPERCRIHSSFFFETNADRQAGLRVSTIAMSLHREPVNIRFHLGRWMLFRTGAHRGSRFRSGTNFLRTKAALA